jgi:DNA-binding MarR family transcriptional regulator
MMRDRSTSVKPPPAHPVDDVASEGTNVLFDVWLLARATGQLLDPVLSPVGLDADEFGIYSALSASDTTTPGELARWLSVAPTTVSSVVRRLEGRGHLTRTRNPADGRSYVLALTPAGRAAHQAAGEAFLDVLERVQTALGRAEPDVRRSLTTLRRAIDAVAADSSS